MPGLPPLPPPRVLFALVWIGFALSWILAGLWRSPATRTLFSPVVGLYRALLLLGFVLMNQRASMLLHAARLWPIHRTGGTILALLTLPGFAFAWWARLSLGRLWSGSITRKADHRLVDTGPYRFARHPIYTGILAACVVSAIAVATWVALAGLVSIAVGLWIKARAEERFLALELDPGAYAAYRSRVPMLVPFMPADRA